MLDTGTQRGPQYSLAEAAILSQSPMSAATTADVLAGTGVVYSTLQTPKLTPRRLVIQGQRYTVSLVLDMIGPVPASFLAAVKAVTDLLDLPHGWNSYSAKPIAVGVAIAAIRVLANLLDSETPPPSVVPRVSGNIQFEWHTKEIDMEIYVDSPERVGFFAEDITSGRSAEGALGGREEEVKRWLKGTSRI